MEHFLLDLLAVVKGEFMLGKSRETGELFVKILSIGRDNLLKASSSGRVFMWNIPE